MLANVHKDEVPAQLPGYPQIHLDDVGTLVTFLKRELCSAELEKMAPYLWMMSLHSSSNISPLHRQIVKGREIVLTEEPSLHLIWLPNRIHLKPIPPYLFSFSFWQQYLLSSTSPIPAGQQSQIAKAAMGYVRSYYYLIQHQSDLRLAQNHNLIPTSITWTQFSAFMSKFPMILDSDVSDRYTFGELRLNRLNFYCKFILGRVRIHRIPTTYGTYFSRFYAPVLFLFAGLSVILNSLQVELGVEALAVKKWPKFWTLCRVLTMSALAISFLLLLFLFSLLVLRFVMEWKHAIKDELIKRRRSRASWEETKGHGMV
jgi:hypothetical protein